jgi:thiamine-phosphate pyrophosphorylase
MIYVVTNRKDAGTNFFKKLEEAIEAGIDAIIVREKDLKTSELLDLTLKIKKIIGEKKVKLIVNGNYNVAKNVNADAFHMTYKNFINKPFFKSIGVSIHSKEEAIEVEKNGANYILAGHIFKTKCKENLTPKGIEWLSSIKNEVKIPVIAIGGINSNNLSQLVKIGITNIAVMSLIMNSKNISKEIKNLKMILNTKNS